MPLLSTIASSSARAFGLGSGVFGQESFTTPGTYSWTAPAGVYSVSVVCVGAGGTYSPGGGLGATGGGGGALAYANNIAVTPGNTYTVVVGDIKVGIIGYGESSSFNSTSVVTVQVSDWSDITVQDSD